jgi:hypothetical protein
MEAIVRPFAIECWFFFGRSFWQLFHLLLIGLTVHQPLCGMIDFQGVPMPELSVSNAGAMSPVILFARPIFFGNGP